MKDIGWNGQMWFLILDELESSSCLDAVDHQSHGRPTPCVGSCHDVRNLNDASSAMLT